MPRYGIDLAILREMILAQIVVSPEVAHGLITTGVIAVAGLVGKLALKGAVDTAVEKLNVIVTANTNRIRSEMLDDFDAKHEENKGTLTAHADDDRREFSELRKSNAAEFQRLNLRLDAAGIKP